MVSIGLLHEITISSFSYLSAQPKIFDGPSRETILGLDVFNPNFFWHTYKPFGTMRPPLEYYGHTRKSLPTATLPIPRRLVFASKCPIQTPAPSLCTIRHNLRRKYPPPPPHHHTYQRWTAYQYAQQYSQYTGDRLHLHQAHHLLGTLMCTSLRTKCIQQRSLRVLLLLPVKGEPTERIDHLVKFDLPRRG